MRAEIGTDLGPVDPDKVIGRLPLGEQRRAWFDRSVRLGAGPSHSGGDPRGAIALVVGRYRVLRRERPRTTHSVTDCHRICPTSDKSVFGSSGGNHLKRIWSVIFSKPCDHEATLVVQSVGVRREVCENCGHISFAIAATAGALEPVELPEASGL